MVNYFNITILFSSVGIKFPKSLLQNANTPNRLVITVCRQDSFSGGKKPLFDRGPLTSSIISATFGGVHLKNLSEPIVLYFTRNSSIIQGIPQCNSEWY